jgi:hypothetical protein
MRTRWWAPLAAGLVLGLVGPAPADDQAEVRAVLDKAIQAVGGAEKLTKYKAATWKGKGKFYGLGDGIDYTGEWAVQGYDQMRFVIDIEVMGQKIKQTIVRNGDKGWIRVNEMLLDMDKDMVAEQKEQAYANALASLEPLAKKEQKFDLAPLGEIKVDDRTAVGVRISSKGHRDVSLFFDKENGLLLKSEWQSRDFMQGGKEVTQQILYSDYKDVEGLKHAMKVVVKSDDKPLIDAELYDLKLEEQLDDSVFVKP